MVFKMPHDYYIKDEKSGSPILRRLLVLLLVLVLVGGTIVGLYIFQSDRQSERVLQDFQTALKEERYDEAIGLYRQTQEKALASGLMERNQKKYQAALTSMEELTALRLQSIETQLLAQKQLSLDDLTFAEKMAEVSSVRLISFLRQLCQDYMVGKIELDVMASSFNQMVSLKNLSDAVRGLPAEFDKMTAAKPQMIAAVGYLQNKDYWLAYEGFMQIMNNADLTGFVHDQTRLQIEACKTAMYQPLLEESRSLILGGRYLSAQTALQKLEVVFPKDQAIANELAICKKQVPEQLVAYNGTIEIISIKPLIVNTARAFDGDAYAAAAADSMLTVDEFNAMLEQLYANQFILIDSSRIYTSSRQLNQLMLPPGKKPLVIVLEGLNYYASRRETGNSWDLVLDETGEVSAEYPDESGKMILDRKGEAIGILDEFAKAHRTFLLTEPKGQFHSPVMSASLDRLPTPINWMTETKRCKTMACRQSTFQIRRLPIIIPLSSRSWIV